MQWMTPLRFAGAAAGRRTGPASYGETSAAAKARVEAIPIGDPVIAFTPTKSVSACVELYSFVSR